MGELKLDEEERIKVSERVTLIRRGKRGLWQMEFHYQGHRRKSTRTANLKVAKRRAIQLEAKLIEGSFSLKATHKTNATKSVTIESAISDYIRNHKTEGSRPKTYKRYKGMLDLFRERMRELGIQSLAAVDIKSFDKFRESRQPELMPVSMYKEGTTIKRFFAWCVERKLLDVNPLENRLFKRPKKTKKTSVMTLTQINAILKDATPDRSTVFALLAFTGMRISEARNLLVSDIDLDKDWIYIRSREGLRISPMLTGMYQSTPV